MAFAHINPLAALWQNMGVSWLLQPRDAPFTKGTAKKTLPKVAPAKVSRASRPLQRAPSAGESPKIQAPEQAPWQPLPMACWPDAWRLRLENAKKGVIAWTYLKLDTDLEKDVSIDQQEQAARKERGAFMRRIFRDLAHPAGTHTFWPVCAREVRDFPPRDELFWSGISALGCRGVVIMGSGAGSIVLPGKTLRPLMQLRQHGRLVWILWDIDALIATPANYQRMLTFLRNSLRPFRRS